MAEKSNLLSVAGIAKYKRIMRDMVEICYDIVQLQVPPDIRIVAGK